MTRYDAIVIGGGINGLVAGAVLARRGKSVCILEQRTALGGMATLTEGDGPALAHLLYNLSPQACRDIGLDPRDLPFRTTPIPTVSLAEDGRHVVLRDGSAETVEGTAHPDAKAARALMARLANYGDLLRHLAEAPPPGGMSLPRQLWRLRHMGLGAARLGKTEVRNFLHVLLSNAYDLIRDEMPDGPLAGLLAADAVRGAAAGPRSPGTVFNLIYRMGHGGVVTLPEGGVGVVAAAVAGAARTAGARIETGTSVSRILIEDDKVSGIETADGTILHAPRVLVSAGPQAALAMTGTQHEDIETTRRIRTIRARGTTAKINLKLEGFPAIPGLSEDLMRARLVFAPSANYVEKAFNPSKYGGMSESPVIEAVMTECAGAPWLSAIVQYAPADLTGGWTDAARDRLLTSMLNTLARVAPGLPKQVRGAQVVTPDQIERATGAPGGHWHHAEMALDQVLTLRPANGLAGYAMGPKGLFLCGASSHPGGDIMGLAGRNGALAALEARS
jgi:phytoene dehydrogenase-like protein